MKLLSIKWYYKNVTWQAAHHPTPCQTPKGDGGLNAEAWDPRHTHNCQGSSLSITLHAPQNGPTSPFITNSPTTSRELLILIERQNITGPAKHGLLNHRCPGLLISASLWVDPPPDWIHLCLKERGAPAVAQKNPPNEPSGRKSVSKIAEELSKSPHEKRTWHVMASSFFVSLLTHSSGCLIKSLSYPWKPTWTPLPLLKN
jgi:hypothetical protein